MSEFDPVEVIGRTGLAQYGGYLNEEFLKDLQSGRSVRVFREMRDNDPTTGAVLFAILNTVSQVDWWVEASGTDPEDIQAKDFLESCIADLDTPWSMMVKDILFSVIPFGFNIREIVYKRRLGQDIEDLRHRSRFADGLIGWRKMPLRSCDSIQLNGGRWDFDLETQIMKGVYQIPAPDFKMRYIPKEKFLLFRATTEKDNPEGRSCLRSAYRPWYFLKKIEVFEAIGVERDLAGYPMLQLPPEWLMPSASPEIKSMVEEYKKMIINVRRDEQEGLILPMMRDANGNEMVKFQLLSAGGTRQFNTNDIIQRKKQEIATSFLADFILLGHEKTGSFALADSKTALFAVAIGAFLDEIRDVFNMDAIPKLFNFNKGNLRVRELPKLCHGDVETQDLVQLGDYLTKLTGAGASFFPDAKLENWFRKQAGIPEKQLEKTI